MRKNQHLKRACAVIFLWFWNKACLLQNKPPASLVHTLNKPLKMAFVKTYEYTDLYTQPGQFNRSVLLSSNHRSGPVGLAEPEIEADFIVLEVDSSRECQVFKEKFYRLSSRSADRKRNYRRNQLREVAILAKEVEWSKYDVVWAMDNAVPARITKSFPEVVWCTMLEDHRMPSYKTYLRSPPDGYDLFFNQCIGKNPFSLISKRHVVDWPYCFQKSDSISRILGIPKLIKRGIIFENHSKIIKKVKSIPLDIVHRKERSLKEHLETLAEVKFFCAYRPWRPLWGNALVEAASSGCIVIANPNLLWNSAILQDNSRIFSENDTLTLCDKVLSDSTFEKSVTQNQDKLVDWHCFHNPLLQLFNSAKNLNRSIKLDNLAN